MTEIKVGDIVRIKDRPGWPSPPGYLLAGSEGEVTTIREEGFVIMHLQKTNSGIAENTTLVLRIENVEKV